MNVAITKKQLKELQSHCGEVDLGTGLVFENLKAPLDPETNLYTGELVLVEPKPDAEYEPFDLVKIIGDGLPPKPQVLPMGTVTVEAKDEAINGADSEHLD